MSAIASTYLALLLLRLSDGIERLGDRRLGAAIVEGGEGLGDQVADVVPPDE
jgi:hypothetical protein